MPGSILFIFTSVDKTLLGKPSGWFLPEGTSGVASNHSQDAEITFAAPAGPNPPVDPTSLEMFKEDEDSVKFLQDETVQQKLATALTLQEVKIADYDAIYYPGGHGPMIDLAVDAVNAKLLEEAVHEKKIIGAVCHGQGALLSAQVTHLIHKRSILHGKNVTGFSNAEEETIGFTKDIPFLLEDKLVELGAKYTKANEPFGAHVVIDGNLITGQNPASSKPIGEALLATLDSRSAEAVLAQGVEMEGVQGGRISAI